MKRPKWRTMLALARIALCVALALIFLLASDAGRLPLMVATLVLLLILLCIDADRDL